MKKLYSFASIYLRAVQLNVLQEAPKETDPGACGTCGGRCCKWGPGVTHPLQFGNTPPERIKNMTEALVSKRYAVDAWEMIGEGERNVYYIRPALKGKEQVFDFSYGGECTFLGDKGCELQHESKPAECLGLQPGEGGKNCTEHKTLNKERLALDEWVKYQSEVKQAAYTAEQILGD
jgi:hypothetical protein